MAWSAGLRPQELDALGADEVLVWRADVSALEGQFAGFHGLLDRAERDRAQRFRFDRDRRRFVLARGWLRTIVAPHVGSNPADVVFTYSAHGKPELAGPNKANLRFNVSHSGSLVLIALTRGREVGVDVELVQPAVAQGTIADRYFTRAESASIDSAPIELRPGRFFDCWVRKEAALKAWGVGLSFELARFDVAAGAALSGTLVGPLGTPGAGRTWSLRALDAGTDYRAALVVEGSGWSLRCIDWATP